MKTVLFDLDGTLANIDHRLHFVRGGSNRWDEFFKACVEDVPNYPVVEVARAMYARDVRVIIVSARSDIVRTETEQWLMDNCIEHDALYMRPQGDYRKDTILKKEMLAQLRKDFFEPDILFVVDDRQSVVDMWREEGLVCLQCAAWKENGRRSGCRWDKGALTLMVGPSGAGKSTWLVNNYREYGISLDEVISSDTIRSELCGNFRDQSKNEQVFSYIHSLIETRINHGLDCVIDATNIKRADRLAMVKAAGVDVKIRYIVVDRPMSAKRASGGWRNELDFDLIGKHDQTFKSQLKDILKGDNLAGVEVIDVRTK